MDMLNGDLYLKNDAESKKTKSTQGRAGCNEAESSFHFIAFVPIQGKVWKLDGLERQPQILGIFCPILMNPISETTLSISIWTIGR